MKTKTLGSILKTLREEKNLSQLKLAEELHIGNSTLSQYESDKRVPSDDIKKKIADYFDVSLDYLMGNSTLKNSVSNSEPLQLSKKDKSDIAKDLNNIKQQLIESDELMFDGMPMDDESITKILFALEIGMEMVRKKHNKR